MTELTEVEQLKMAVLPNVVCPQCRKVFKLAWMDAVGGPRETLEISACESGGVYGVAIVCPHCKRTEELE